MLIGPNGQQINANDYQMLQEMLTGSLEQHIANLNISAHNPEFLHPEFFTPAINVYEEGLAFLPNGLRNAMESQEEINVTDFIHNMYSDLGKETLRAMKSNLANPEMLDELNEFERKLVNGWGEENLVREIKNEEPLASDTAAGYEFTAGKFSFSGKKIDGIEDIVEYDPDKDRVKGLYEGRSGNSTTLKDSADSLRQQLNALPDDEENEEEREKLQDRIDAVEKGTLGMNVGAEVSRMHSSELRDKKDITFGDVYKAYTDINRALRPGDPDGGKLRGKYVQASNVYGVGASMVPEAVVKTMQTIADGMNQIKNTEDPALKKSMAVELSAFAYQMTLSEHSFNDGNGRTCRLFVDTILQTFGLPPHTPIPEEMQITKTMGEEMDFTKGAEVFMECVKKSSDVLAAERALQAKEGVIGEPGEITAAFSSLMQKSKELKEKPEPDKVAQQGQYRKYKSDLRANERTTAAFKDALKNAPVSDEQWDMAYYAVMGEMTAKKKLPEDAKLADFAQALEVRMTDEQKKSLTDALNAYKDPADMSPEEKVTYPYQQKAQELKSQIPADIANDPDMKAQYEYALDYAAKHLNTVKEDVRADLLKVDDDIQSMEAALDRNVQNNLRPNYENGKYDNILTTNKNTGEISITDGKENVYDEILNKGTQFSEKTKEGFRKMIAKMDEMGLHTYDHVPNGEDGTKVYSFNKLGYDRKNFKEAMDSGDPGKIMSAQIVYEKSIRDTQELFNIAKEYFNNEPGLFPGNMDSIRNTAIPFEFAGDVQTAAQVNTVFQTFIAVKEQGMDLEEYLKNPVGGVMKDAIDRLKPVCFKEATEGLSLEESLDLFAQAGDFNETGDAVKYAVPEILFARQVKNPNLMETDPAHKMKNDIIADTMVNVILGITNSEDHKFNYFNSLESKKNSPEYERCATQTLKNLMLVKDEDRNLNSIFAYEPEKDLLGHKIGEGFNAEEYINRKPVDYEGIMNRADRLIKRSSEYDRNDSWFVDDTRMLKAASELYMDVLTAHPEDADKPEYKKMQEAMNRNFDKIAELSAEEAADLANAKKEAANEMLAENRLNYRIQNEPAKYLGELEREAERTGNFMKYMEGLMKVQDYDQKIEDERLIHRPTPEQKKFQREFQKYKNETLRLDDNGKQPKGLDFYRNVTEALITIYNDDCCKYAQESEALAKRIRNGEVSVDPMYADLKKDYHASMNIAHQILADGDRDRRIQALTSLKMDLGMQSPKKPSGIEWFFDDYEDQKNTFLKSGKIGNNYSEREHMLAVSQKAYDPSMKDYGLKRDRNNNMVSVAGRENPQQMQEEMLQKSLNKAMDYYGNMEQIRFNASQKLQEMKGAGIGGRSGSDEFKAMYDALENVTKLSIESTPAQVENALRNLCDKSEDYKKKIDGQMLSNIRQKGKNRYNMANDLMQLAEKEYDKMQDTSLKYMDPNEKIGKQMDYAMDVLDEFKAKQAQRQAQAQQNVNAPVQNVNAPAQNVNAPVQNANAPVQNANAPVQNVQQPEAPANAPENKEPHRKLDAKEIKGMLGGDKKEPARRNSVREPAKRPEIEKPKNDKKEVLDNNKAIQPKKK